MSKATSKILLSAIESPETWNKLKASFSNNELIEVLRPLIRNGNAFDLVQSIKVLDCIGEYSSKEEIILEKMEKFCCIKKHPITYKPFQFQQSDNNLKRVLLLCGDITSNKVKRLATKLLEKSIPFKISILSNFKPEKPYKLAKGTWYGSSHYNSSEESQLENHITQPLLSDPLQLNQTDLADTLTICMGTGIFNKQFIQKFPNGIINIHNGLLPCIRGLDSPAWSQLTGNEYGISMHIINSKVDLGKCIFSTPLKENTKNAFDDLILENIIFLISRTISDKLCPTTIKLTGGNIYPMLGHFASEALTQSLKKTYR